MLNPSHLRWLAVWLLRVALAFSFLSAVADRFGLWGPFGVAGVAWGDFERFTDYTARLLWFLPPSLVSPAAILATGAEVLVAGGLLVGWRLPFVGIRRGGVAAQFRAGDDWCARGESPDRLLRLDGGRRSLSARGGRAAGTWRRRPRRLARSGPRNRGNPVI